MNVRTGLLCLLLLCTSGIFAQNEFKTILDNINAELHVGKENVAAIDRNATTFIHSIQNNGSWTDIDYSNSDITLWKPIAHLERIQSLVLAYVAKESIHSGEGLMYNAIVNGLRYWYAKDPQSKNWWHNQINTPQLLGELLITMRYGKVLLPRTLEDSLIQSMKRGDPYKQTGANKLDVAIHYIYRAALTQNSALMDSAVSQAFQPISFTNQEGLQYDYSYLQHGRQLQISSYGSVFISGEYKVAGYVKGTSYALAGEKLKMLSNYYLNTYIKSIRGGYIDFNVEGRGVSRENILNKLQEKTRLQQAKTIDDANGTEWYAAMARTSLLQPADYMIQPSHTFFWSSDYTLHIRPGYSFNVRTVSTRTIRTETGNKENLLGKFMADGATNIQRSGSEYYNIMPVWEWDKIPGTTSHDYAIDQPTIAQWGEKGSTDFVGGVSDSMYGVSVYDMNYNDVTAKKAWFFFDKEVVCLGAGIHSSAKENTITTINQCWLKGNVFALCNDKISSINSNLSSVYTNLKWLLHDSIGYFFIGGNAIHVSTETQKGDWYHINNSMSKKTVAGNVFKVWWDHGVQPVNAGYAYVVVPGLGSEKDMRSYDLNDIKILRNDDTIQAVKHEGLARIGVVFYKAGECKVENFSIVVDKPCVVMLSQLNKPNIILHIADPSQQNDVIHVQVSSNKIKGGIKQIDCKLPAKPYAGKTVAIQVM